LADYISKNKFETIGGSYTFDENGQSEARSLMIQYDANEVVQTVYPPDSASGPILYPMPTWDHRDCILVSECKRENENLTVAISDTGNLCDDKGMCVCSDPVNFKSVGSGTTANCVQMEEMNYIAHFLKVLSWILSGLLLALCIFCLGWTYHYRENTLVKVSQPLFLAFVIAGSILSVLSILTMGVEGSYREDTYNIRAVDAACMATPWLWGMGFAITYSALFAKIWRVHKLYKLSAKMRRKAVDYKDVYYIMFIILIAELIVLITFQVVSPYIWQRDVIDDMGGYAIESIGSCDSEYGGLFFLTLIFLNVICLFVALVLCWKTKDLPSDFAESNYITLSVMFMFQILLLSVPVSIMLRDDANVYFFIRAGAVFLQNFTVLVLIFFPKMNRIYNKEDTNASVSDAVVRQSCKASSRGGSVYGLPAGSRNDSTKSKSVYKEFNMNDSIGGAKFESNMKTSCLEDESSKSLGVKSDKEENPSIELKMRRNVSWTNG